MGGGMGFNGAASAIEYGVGRQAPGGFNRFGAAGLGASSGNLAPLFPVSGSTRSLPGGANGPFAAAPLTPAPLTLPSLNQLMRGSIDLPLTSSYGAYRLSPQDRFAPNGNIGDLGRPYGAAIFTSSDLGNGMFLSAGSTFGSRSTAGAPAATLGNGQSGGARHSGPSVALKLSF